MTPNGNMVLILIIIFLCISRSQDNYSRLRIIRQILSLSFNLNMSGALTFDILHSEFDSLLNNESGTQNSIRTILNSLSNVPYNSDEQNKHLLHFNRTVKSTESGQSLKRTEHPNTQKENGQLELENDSQKFAKKERMVFDSFLKTRRQVMDTIFSNVRHNLNPQQVFYLNDAIDFGNLQKETLSKKYKKPRNANTEYEATTIINTDDVQTIFESEESSSLGMDFQTKEEIREIITTSENSQEYENGEENYSMENKEDKIHQLTETSRRIEEIFTTSESANGYKNKTGKYYDENKEHRIHRLNVISPSDYETFLKYKSEKDGEGEMGVIVNYGSTCDFLHQTTCWFERAVGETLTLMVNISSQRDEAIGVHWLRLYHKRHTEKGIIIEIEPERLPWNMVLGSGGRELRLNPVTNTDLDPNAITATVFLVILNKERKEFQRIKELDFHIDIPAIDMKNVYFGEELTINIENFLTLPVKGNLLLDWGFENDDRQVLPMPSNFMVSRSGRSLIIKEFRNEQANGVLTCVVYSSKDIAVAKRRFRILNIAERRYKRSLNSDESQRIPRIHRRRLPFNTCLNGARKYRDAVSFRKMLDSSKPLSRKKRYWQTLAKRRYGRDCQFKNLHRRLHPRWIPFLFGVESETTLDPKLMSLEKLIQLSENSDGTLDDVIPHEVHFVEPAVTIISDDFMQPNYQRNCSSKADCGTGAVCVIPKGQKRSGENYKGYCYCRPEYFGDGFTCKKIPRVIHREKRIRRTLMNRDLQIRPNLFYSDKDGDFRVENGFRTREIKEDSPEAEPPKAREYEEEDASLLSRCVDGKDCSPHATCVSGSNDKRFCKCIPGFRGNGIFCWEMIDYIPS